MKTVKEMREALNARNDRSAWNKAVTLYALELIEEMDDGAEIYGSSADKKDLLNGASDWNQYSWGGCSLIYNEDIARRTCSPSEFKRSREGERRPNSREEWLDTQARALFQAETRLMRLARA